MSEGQYGWHPWLGSRVEVWFQLCAISCGPQGRYLIKASLSGHDEWNDMCDKKGLVIISSNNYNQAWLKCHLLPGVFHAVVKGGASAGVLWLALIIYSHGSRAVICRSCLPFQIRSIWRTEQDQHPALGGPASLTFTRWLFPTTNWQ